MVERPPGPPPPDTGRQRTRQPHNRQSAHALMVPGIVGHAVGVEVVHALLGCVLDALDGLLAAAVRREHLADLDSRQVALDA